MKIYIRGINMRPRNRISLVKYSLQFKATLSRWQNLKKSGWLFQVRILSSWFYHNDKTFFQLHCTGIVTFYILWKPLRNLRFFAYVICRKRSENQRKNKTKQRILSKTKSTCQNSITSELFQKWPKNQGIVLALSLSIDLKDAYYSVPIHSDFQKHLKFSWRGQLYKYVCFPNGLAPRPRQFTKLLKPVFSSLRKLGHIPVVYIDDTWLKSEDYNSCVNNIAETITLLDRLGFVIHPEKSILIPTQEITFLGFIFNSANMTVQLTPERALNLKTTSLDNLEATTPLISDVAWLLGHGSSLPHCFKVSHDFEQLRPMTK